MSKKQPQSVTDAVNEMTRALNECARLIREELERTAKQINDAWKKVKR